MNAGVSLFGQTPQGHWRFVAIIRTHFKTNYWEHVETRSNSARCLGKYCTLRLMYAGILPANHVILREMHRFFDVIRF